MPIDWDIDEHAMLATVRVSGAMTLSDARQALTQLYAQPCYRPPMVDLWDLRAAEIDTNPGEVAALVHFIEGHRGEHGTDRTAVVVSNAVEFGITRMYQAHAEGCLPIAIQVFTRLADAYSWLGKTQRS